MNNTDLMDAMRVCARYMRIFPDAGSGQPKLLGILLDKGEISQRELQQLSDVRSATISETLAKLEAAGMITRRVSETDRRTVIVNLTERGMIAANELEDTRTERADELFACFDESERDEFGAHVEKLGAYWREKFGDGDFREHFGERHGFGGHMKPHHDKRRGDRFTLLSGETDGNRNGDERERDEHRRGEHGHGEHRRGEHEHGEHGRGEHPRGKHE